MGKAGVFVAIALAAFLVWWFGFRSEGAPPTPIDETPFAAEHGTDASADEGDDRGGPELATTALAAANAAKPPVAEPAPLPPNSVELRGRVLDERRRPVAGAEIHTVLNPEAPSVPVARSEADGSFVVRGIVRPSSQDFASLRAVKGERVAMAGVVAWPSMPESQDVGVLSMGPAHGLDLVVRDAAGAPVADADIALEATIRWHRGVLLMGRSAADGTCRFGALPEGGYRILAGKADHGRCVHPVALPRKSTDVIELRLGPERPVRIVVSDKTTGVPIPGARILLEEFIPTLGGMPGQVVPYVPRMSQPTTDAAGHANLIGIGAADQIQVHAIAEGYPGPGDSRMMMANKIEDAEVQVKLAKLRTVRWPLADDDPLAPSVGTALGLEQAQGAMTAPLPTSIRVESGEIVAEGCDPGLFHLIVTTPDGAYAQLFVSHDSDIGREARFQKTRKVSVTVKNHKGEPATGVYVSLRNQGNATLIEGTPVDAGGRVEFAVRWSHLVDVFVGRSTQSYAGTSVGSLDLKEKGGSLEATLPPPGRAVEATVYIDGVARLPPAYTLGAGFGAQAPTDVSEDPEKGILRFLLATTSPAAQKVPLSAVGFLPMLIDVPAAGADRSVPVRVRVDLARGGFCILRLKPPADGDHQTRVVATGQAASFMPVFRPGGGETIIGEEDGIIIVRHGPLKPGSYTAVDASSHKRSEPFEIREGGETLAAFDLSQVAVLKGQVELPDGFDMTKARVKMSGPNIHASSHPGQNQGAYVNREGAFQVRIPGDEKVTLRVTHPMLVPDPLAGSAEVTKAVPGIRLKLIEGSSATFLLDPPVEMPRRGRTGSPQVQVLLYAGVAEGEPLQRLSPTHEDGVFSIGGFSPGTYTVVVSTRFRAPHVLRDVVLGKTNDWGTLSTKPGATVRIKVLVRDGQDAPRIFASVRCKDGPSYSRYINSGGEAEVLLRGLGAGTFDLRAHPMRSMGAGQAGLQKTITSDGETEIVLEMDLR